MYEINSYRRQWPLMPQDFVKLMDQAISFYCLTTPCAAKAVEVELSTVYKEWSLRH